MTAPTALPSAAPAAVRAAACAQHELPQLVHALLAGLAGSLPASSATVVTVFHGTQVRSWATSGPAGVDLDGVQTAAAQGPAVTAAADPGRLVVAGDVWADPRWVLPTTGPTSSVRSVVAVALPGSADVRPVLVVHGSGPELVVPDVVEQIAAVVPGLAAAVAVVRARLEAADLQVALASNRLIGAAIGIAMVSRKLTYDAAADLLRSASNHTNTRLADLAGEVLLTGQVPEPVVRPTRPRRPVPPL